MDSNKCWQEGPKDWDPLNCWWKCKIQPLWKRLAIPQTELPYYPAILLLEISTQKTRKHVSIQELMFIVALFVTKKEETTQMLKNWWVDKQNMVDPYNGVLLVHKKEWSTDICYNMDEPWKYHAKWKKPNTKGHTLYVSLYM